jgi:hypothetical protein
MLNSDVREAVATGEFHIFTATHVEQVMERLSGLPAGAAAQDGRFEAGSFQRSVQKRIEELQELERSFANQNGDNHEQ